jgi:DNA-binding beta-propeller fold protein YncE
MKPLWLGLIALWSAAAALNPAQAGTMFLGGYPNQLMVIDEAKGTVTQEIDLKTGLPMSMRLSDDGKLLYATTITTSGIEVMDVATRTIVNSFSLNTPAVRYRFTGGVADRSGRYFYILGTRFDKGLDAFRVSKQQFMVVDLQERKVVRSAELEPDDQKFSYRGNLMLSPDGKTLYAFRDKVIVVNTSDLKTVDHFDLSKPDSPGMQDVSFGGGVGRLQTPGQFVSLFETEDPYIHNKTFGIARLDLNTRQFTFTPIGPSPKAMAGLEVSPDGKNGYTVAVNGDLGNQRCEFWRFDLGKNRALDKAEFECRRRFYFGISGDGRKLYIYGAGFDVAVYDANTLKPRADWQLTHDITISGMVIIP